MVCALGAIAMIGADGEWTMRAFMHAYMGLFLLVFALLKLFDPGQFADGLAMYDLLASRLHAYGYVYPLIELALALAYLAHLAPATTYAATIAVFGFGALGVANALRKGLDVECACMGNVLGVPLSTVALSEDLLMVAMAAMLLMM